jgi:hypothetical protein
MWLFVFRYLGAVAVAVALALATLKELCPLVCHLRAKQVDINLYVNEATYCLCRLFGGGGGAEASGGLHCMNKYRNAGFIFCQRN